MADGWIKLHRRFLDSSIWKNGNLMRFWVWCLLKASHSSVKARVRYIEVELSPGQFVFGRLKAAEDTGLSEREVRTCVEALKGEKAISVTNHSTKQFSVITIENWESYQFREKHGDQPSAMERPGSDQAATTYKNDQEIKKIAGAHARREEKGMDADEVGPSSSELTDASFSEFKGKVLEVWSRERKAVGLLSVPTAGNSRAAVYAAAMIERGEWTLEIIEAAVKTLMTFPEERRNYTLRGLLDNLEMWVNGGPVRSERQGGKPSAERPKQNAEPANWMSEVERQMEEALGKP